MTFCSDVYETYNPVTGQRLLLVMLILGAQKKDLVNYRLAVRLLDE